MDSLLSDFAQSLADKTGKTICIDPTGIKAAPVLTKREADGWIDNLVSALVDPIIVMPGGWGDDLPEWLRTRVHLERLIENMQAVHEGRELTATDAEAACYLFTASLTAPIGGDWTDIYVYLTGIEMRSQTKSELPADLRVVTLTDYQSRELRQLKNWIYERRMKHRKEKSRGERYQERQAEEGKEKELVTAAVQPAFF